MNDRAEHSLPARVEALCGLAASLAAQDRFQEAEAVLRRAQVLAEESEKVAPARRRGVWAKLGALYHQAGRLSDAEASYQYAIAMLADDETIADHPEGPDAQAELGALSISLGSVLAGSSRYEEAESLFRAAMKAFETVAGADSDEVAVAAHQLASLLAMTERSAEAADLYERAISIRRRVLGPGHPAVASTLHNLALLRDAAGCSEEARLLWAEAEAALRTAPGTTLGQDRASA